MELAGKQHAQVAGSLLLPITVTGRQLELPRRLNFDLEAQVLGSHAGADMLLGLPTLVRTGFLQAVIDNFPFGRGFRWPGGGAVARAD